MSEWQPIGTAPRDGTSVLIYTLGDEQSGTAPRVREAIWHIPHEGAEHGWWQTITHRVYELGLPSDPTHWMALPDPPPPSGLKP